MPLTFAIENQTNLPDGGPPERNGVGQARTRHRAGSAPRLDLARPDPHDFRKALRDPFP